MFDLFATQLTIDYTHWLGFAALVVVLLTLDLFVFHRTDHTPTLAESAWWTVFWIGIGLGFNVVVWWLWGHETGVVFLSAYLIEKSLSMDNIFVFVVIFRFFRIPMKYQYRVLFWGILGAVGMRLVFIVAGVGLIHMFEWVIPLFGLLLLYTAYKLARHSGAEVHPENNLLLRTVRKWFPVTKDDHDRHGRHFFVHEAGKLCVTPMFLVLLVVESTDVVFAIDSVPAVIGIIPRHFNPAATMFIAFTSNVFAILGLRALYFLLAGMVDAFRYLHYGLAAVLGFVGLKMLLAHWIELSPWTSLGIIFGLLAISVVGSLAARDRKEPGTAEDDEPGAEADSDLPQDP